SRRSGIALAMGSGLANGGVGLLYSVLYYITKNPSYLVLLAVSFAAANADTWATELGILSLE
ncbi:DUF92 domain-containing protein, partial [Klebsiella aerogenes]|uniref:DUF92 domain-containing protein n=1 Tax=Klebsiella aerogenes TaxID=548 RepID=UPI00195335DE